MRCNCSTGWTLHLKRSSRANKLNVSNPLSSLNPYGPNTYVCMIFAGWVEIIHTFSWSNVCDAHFKVYFIIFEFQTRNRVRKLKSTEILSKVHLTLLASVYLTTHLMEAFVMKRRSEFLGSAPMLIVEEKKLLWAINRQILKVSYQVQVSSFKYFDCENNFICKYTFHGYILLGLQNLARASDRVPHKLMWYIYTGPPCVRGLVRWIKLLWLIRKPKF